MDDLTMSHESENVHSFPIKERPKVLFFPRLKSALPSALGIDETVIGAAGLDFYDANWQNYEALYLSKEERRKKGPQGYMSANVISAKKPTHFANIIFKDPFVSESTAVDLALRFLFVEGFNI